MNHAEYVAFWREVARKHKKILHSDTEKHFGRLVLTSDPILDASTQVSELVAGMKNLHTPCLLVVAYAAAYGDERGDAMSKTIQGRIIILSDPKKGDYDDEELVLSETEQIGEECLAYAKEHFDNNPEEGFFELNGGGSDKLANITGRQLFGTGLDFNILLSDAESLHFDATKFNE